MPRHVLMWVRETCSSLAASWLADAAMAQNMVDGVATIDDVFRKMRRDVKGSGKASVHRLALAQRVLATIGSAT